MTADEEWDALCDEIEAATNADFELLEPKEPASWWDFTPSEERALKGVALMAFVKLVLVGLIGFDMEAVYIWPLTWVAFAMMVPWIVECFVDDKEES